MSFHKSPLTTQDRLIILFKLFALCLYNYSIPSIIKFSYQSFFPNLFLCQFVSYLLLFLGILFLKDIILYKVDRQKADLYLWKKFRSFIYLIFR